MGCQLCFQAKDHVVRKVNTTETVTKKTSKKSDKTAKHIVKEKRSDTLEIYNEDSLKDSLYVSRIDFFKITSVVA